MLLNLLIIFFTMHDGKNGLPPVGFLFGQRYSYHLLSLLNSQLCWTFLIFQCLACHSSGFAYAEYSLRETQTESQVCK